MALLLAIGLAVLWVQAPALYGKGDAAKTAAATTRGAILTVAAALIAATAAGAGVYITARTIRVNQQALKETQRANQLAHHRELESQVTDRYTKAIEQLGSGKLDVRLGGIYALERIAVDSPRDHPTIVEVLSAFIREHSNPARRVRRRAPVSSEHPGPTTDVQAALTVLGRLPSRAGVRRAQLPGANLSGARLDGMNLSDAHLGRVNLSGAVFGRVNLSGAFLAGANLSRANLGWANLSGAFLAGASLSGADLVRANLSGANLRQANDLSSDQLELTRGDAQTQLPEGLHRPSSWTDDK